MQHKQNTNCVLSAIGLAALFVGRTDITALATAANLGIALWRVHDARQKANYYKQKQKEGNAWGGDRSKDNKKVINLR